MKMMTYRVTAVVTAASFALLSVACSGSDDGLTAENITVEECADLFPADDGTEEDDDADEDSDSEEMLEGDYDADGDVDEDDEAIEERCVELMAEAEADGEPAEEATSEDEAE